MRRCLRLMLLIGVTLVGARAFGGTPAAVTFFGTLPERADVYGLHLSIVGGATVYSCPNSVTGLSLGCLMNGVGDGAMSGIQISGIHAGGECVYGLQAAGAFAFAEKASGIELAGVASVCRDFSGVQLAGLVTGAESCRGLQVAFYNSSSSMYGVQIGVLNFASPAKDGWVVQLGLVNGVSNDAEKCTWTEGIRYLPLLNVGW